MNAVWHRQYARMPPKLNVARCLAALLLFTVWVSSHAQMRVYTAWSPYQYSDFREGDWGLSADKTESRVKARGEPGPVPAGWEQARIVTIRCPQGEAVASQGSKRANCDDVIGLRLKTGDASPVKETDAGNYAVGRSFPVNCAGVVLGGRSNLVAAVGHCCCDDACSPDEWRRCARLTDSAFQTNVPESDEGRVRHPGPQHQHIVDEGKAWGLDGDGCW